MSYRTSPLAAEATGTVETIQRWGGHTMGGRVPAFLGLAQRTGGVYLENPPSVTEGLRQTGLDFEVKLHTLQTVVAEPVIGPDGDLGMQTTAHELTRHRATVGHFADGTVRPFGPVGSRYQPIQPVEVAEIGQSVVDEAGGSLLALGMYGEPLGSRLYMAFDLGDFEVGGQDKHNLALTIVAANDGTGGVVGQLAPVRLQCTNQTSGIFGRRRSSRFTIRHTSGASVRVQEVRDALGLTFAYVEAYQAEAEKLLAQPMTTDDFVSWERELFGAPADPEEASKNTATMTRNRDDALVSIFTGATNEGVHRTRYAAAQSVIEYLDHVSIVRGSDPDAKRWSRIMAGQTEGQKARAWESLATV